MLTIDDSFAAFAKLQGDWRMETTAITPKKTPTFGNVKIAIKGSGYLTIHRSIEFKVLVYCPKEQTLYLEFTDELLHPTINFFKLGISGISINDLGKINRVISEEYKITEQELAKL